jgi:hypothetical protein
VPEKYHKPNPFERVYSLADAASAGGLLVVRCNHCQRTVHYLAADLVPIVGGEGYARNPPFPCSKCGKTDYVQVTLRSPEAGDWGHLIVRRPEEVVVTQKWKSVRLGD